VNSEELTMITTKVITLDLELTTMLPWQILNRKEVRKHNLRESHHQGQLILEVLKLLKNKKKVNLKISLLFRVVTISSWTFWIILMTNFNHLEKNQFIALLLNKEMKESSLVKLLTRLKKEWWNLKSSVKRLQKHLRLLNNSVRKMLEN
jgi:hypothetical protein